MNLMICLSVLAVGFGSVAATKFERNPASTGTRGVVKLYKNENASGFIRIEGEAAATLYKDLKLKETNSLDGAGPEVFFKTGLSYRCFAEVKDSAKGTSNPTNVLYYACDFNIKSFATGQ